VIKDVASGVIESPKGRGCRQERQTHERIRAMAEEKSSDDAMIHYPFTQTPHGLMIR